MTSSDWTPASRPTLEALAEHPDLVWDLSGAECLVLLRRAELAAEILRSRFAAFRLEEGTRSA